MPIYRPRATAILKLPVFGTASEKKAQEDDSTLLDVPVRCQRVAWLRNDHNHADEVRVSLEWYDAGFDVRYLSSGILSLHIGQADDQDRFVPDDSNLRFIGMISRPRRQSAPDGRLVVECEALDFTSLFLRVKPYRTVGVPSLSGTLSDAWRLICDNTGFYDHQQGKFISTAQSLKSRLVFRGQASDVQLGKAVAPRFRGFGKVHVQPNWDAWAVWQKCVGMVGFLSYIDRGDCIVTTALDYYTAANPARFIYGINVLEHEESRDCDRTAMGIGLISYDPLKGNTIEAWYPPLGSAQLFKSKRKRVIPEGGIDVSKYQVFPYPGITDKDLLQFAAQRVFEEVSRQDMQGVVGTGEMTLTRVDGTTVDALTIAPGQAITVEFDDQLKSALLAKTSQSERIAYLTLRGYSAATAALMAKNVDDFTTLRPDCSVRTLAVEFEASPEGGNFLVKCSYNARVQLTGDTDRSS